MGGFGRVWFLLGEVFSRGSFLFLGLLSVYSLVLFSVHVLVLTVWQRSQVNSGKFALLARGRRLPHVVQNRRPLKAMVLVLEEEG